MATSRRASIIAAGLLALPLLGSLFASEQSQLHVAVGRAPLCRKGVSLGRALVVMESAWRADQKEPARRDAIWSTMLRDGSPASSCALFVTRTLPTTPSAAYSEREARALAKGPDFRADTVILLRVYEAGPNLVFGLLPPHWLGWTEAEFSARALDVRSDAISYDAHIRLARGGLFALRGEAALRRDAFDALERLLGADFMSDDARLVR